MKLSICTSLAFMAYLIPSCVLCFSFETINNLNQTTLNIKLQSRKEKRVHKRYVRASNSIHFFRFDSSCHQCKCLARNLFIIMNKYLLRQQLEFCRFWTAHILLFAKRRVITRKKFHVFYLINPLANVEQSSTTWSTAQFPSGLK